MIKTNFLLFGDFLRVKSIIFKDRSVIFHDRCHTFWRSWPISIFVGELFLVKLFLRSWFWDSKRHFNDQRLFFRSQQWFFNFLLSSFWFFRTFQDQPTPTSKDQGLHFLFLVVAFLLFTSDLLCFFKITIGYNFFARFFIFWSTPLKKSEIKGGATSFLGL